MMTEDILVFKIRGKRRYLFSMNILALSFSLIFLNRVRNFLFLVYWLFYVLLLMVVSLSHDLLYWDDHKVFSFYFLPFFKSYINWIFMLRQIAFLWHSLFMMYYYYTYLGQFVCQAFVLWIHIFYWEIFVYSSLYIHNIFFLF